MPDRFGRRFGVIFGAGGLAACMWIVGGLYAGNAVHHHGAGRWFAIIFIFIFTLHYCATWAVSGKIYASEIQPIQTRAAANNVATGLNFIIVFLSSSDIMGLLQGKIAIVTGASRGIGAAIARDLASKGAKLALGYKSEPSSHLTASLADELRLIYQAEVVAVQADLTAADGPGRLIAMVKDHFESINGESFVLSIIVNNAGVAKMGSVAAVTLEDDILPQYRINVFAPLLLMQAALPYLPHDRSGRIVNISSTSSANGCPSQSVYGGTKAALEAMTRTWARELSERATVNAVNPGPVLTEMFRETSEDFRRGLGPMIELTPLARIREEVDREEMARDWAPMRGRPAYTGEVAAIVGMLCGADSGWCTGSVVCANGGMQFIS
ncbi:MAG: hypothetical protein Q9162_006864 [Coniocarpon cinnabarinum]